MSTPEFAELARRLADREPAFLDELREMVDVDCGTFTPAGVNAVVDRCEARFRAAGWSVERRSHRPARGQAQLGDLLVARLGAGEGPRVLLLGHTDTVFPEGTAAERPLRIEGNLAFGPGVCDMKGGLLAGIFAVEALLAAGWEPPGVVVYIVNPDEEIGSPFSRATIEEEARRADTAFVLEAARANGAIVSSRKGVTVANVRLHGRAAHAGVEPHKGRSAVVEGSRMALALTELNGRWDTVTVNVGVFRGGTRVNVVPEVAELEVDLRAAREDALSAAEVALMDLSAAPFDPDVRVELDLDKEHRPMERTEGTAALVRLAQEVAAQLGFQVEEEATGGASDANTTSALGVPTLDGLGPIGGDDHSAAEWLDLQSVVPRTALLAGLIARSGSAIS